MRSGKLELDFWARFTAQAVLTNVPLALLRVVGGVGLGALVAVSAVFGVLTLALWGVGRPTSTPRPAGSLVQMARSDADRVGSSA